MMYLTLGFIAAVPDFVRDGFGDLFHEDKTLTVLQMSLRSALVFIVALVMVHLAGRRAFGVRTPFDSVVSLLLGATLSRGIVGASSFVGVSAACGVLAGLHWLLAWINMRSPAFRRFINGKSQLIYRDGVKYRETMQATLLTDDDLESAVRQDANLDSLDDVKEAFIETSGQISVVKKDRKTAQKAPAVRVEE